MTFFASAITSFEVRPLRVGVNIDVLIAVDGDNLYDVCIRDGRGANEDSRVFLITMKLAIEPSGSHVNEMRDTA